MSGLSAVSAIIAVLCLRGRRPSKGGAKLLAGCSEAHVRCLQVKRVLSSVAKLQAQPASKQQTQPMPKQRTDQDGDGLLGGAIFNMIFNQ